MSVLDQLDAETRRQIAEALWTDSVTEADLPPGALDALANEKNSNAAFGARFRRRLEWMLAEPDHWLPSYSARYTALLEQTQDGLTPHQAYLRTVFLGLDSSKGYELIPDAANLQFPDRHHLQPKTQCGWHFFVGSVRGDDGHDYSVLVIFWQYALLPLPIAAEFGLSDAENQVFELQLALARKGDRHIQISPPVLAGTTGLLSYSEPGALFHIAIGKNRVESTGPGFTPLRIQARGTHRDQNAAIPLAIDLTLDQPKPILLQGDQGCAPCAGGVGTLYYSIPRLQVEPGGRLRIGDDDVTVTGGELWFDHQWGTGMIPKGSARTEVVQMASVLSPGARSTAWDWFMMQLTGNRELTVASIHSDADAIFERQTGPNPPGVFEAAVSGKYSDPDGVAHAIKGTLRITNWLQLNQSPDPAVYPYTSTWYPNRWEFSFGEEVPADIRSLILLPYVATGQENRYAFASAYREGAVTIVDGQGNTVGHGFAEAVGYADTLTNAIELAGLPDEPIFRERIESSFATKMAAFFEIMRPSTQAELKSEVSKIRGL
jgi:predicted secreted hydrolase